MSDVTSYGSYTDKLLPGIKCPRCYVQLVNFSLQELIDNRTHCVSCQEIVDKECKKKRSVRATNYPDDTSDKMVVEPTY